MNGGGGSWPRQPRIGRPAFGRGCRSASLKPSHCPLRPPAGPAPATHDHSGPQRWRNGGVPKWTRTCTLLLETGGMWAPGPPLGPAPAPGHRGNAAQGRGWPPGASQNPDSSGLSSAVPSGRGGPKRPPSGAQPALRAGSEHPPRLPRLGQRPSVSPAATGRP